MRTHYITSRMTITTDAHDDIIAGPYTEAQATRWIDAMTSGAGITFARSGSRDIIITRSWTRRGFDVLAVAGDEIVDDKYAPTWDEALYLAARM